MVREDLVSSAVAFLQDPSVASAPVDKRKAFLRSKNLTTEEVEVALARAGDVLPSSSALPVASAGHRYPSQSVKSPSPGYGYGPYTRGQWAQIPPDSPRRDWRDWFIMATVTASVGYGLYTIAQRYVIPLIAPPTPAQLEQDKSTIDEQFSRAFILIDQLATDTAALKSAEEERTERLGKALQEVESVVDELKASSRRREEDGKRMQDEVRDLKHLIPKALEGWKNAGDNKLQELGNELKGLKTLVGNRMGGQVANTLIGRSYGSGYTERMMASGSSPPKDSGASGSLNSSGSTDRQGGVTGDSESSTPVPSSTLPRREGLGYPNSDNRLTGRTIPAWQLPTGSVGGNGSKSHVSGTASAEGGDTTTKSASAT